MSWNLQKSIERIQKHLADLGEIDVEKLVKDADLSTLLTPTNCRQVYGAHVYVDVPNFSELASHADGEDFRRVIQAIHVYHREVARIVEDPGIFGGVRIHFQGPKLHALFFRPIDSSEDLASKAMFLQIVLRQFVDRVFNPAFPLLPGLTISGGADLGNAIGTKKRNGRRPRASLPGGTSQLCSQNNCGTGPDARDWRDFFRSSCAVAQAMLSRGRWCLPDRHTNFGRNRGNLRRNGRWLEYER